MATPDAELPEGVRNAGEYAPPGWAPGQPHPGQQTFETYCATCHTLNSQTMTGPGFRGLYERVAEVEYQGKPVQQRLLEYLKDIYEVQDPYFVEMQKAKGPTANPDMTPRGGVPAMEDAAADDRMLLDVIDYILRFYTSDFDEEEYLKRVRLGRDLVSGARSFRNGAPSCIGCHTVGPDNALRGANIGGNVAHTFVAARNAGGVAEDKYSQGLWEILSSEDAPLMHRYYKDGARSPTDVGHLTDGELLAVMTFFEQQLREVGTERESNYLPIFALLLAAMMVLLMEPGLYANLFVREEHEYVDGPYQEEHHDDHGHESDTHSHNDQPPTAGPDAAQESKDTGSDAKQD